MLICMQSTSVRIDVATHEELKRLAASLGATVGATVALAVRPEKIDLAEDSGLPAEVLSLEYLGADSLIACKVGACEWIVRQSGRVRLAVGDRIRLSWPAAENHWFEAKSGKRQGI